MQEVLTVATPPSLEPVSLDDAKGWLRVELDFTDDDDLITALIPAARGIVEAKLKQSLVNRVYLWVLDYFPNRLVLTPTSVVWDSWLNSRLYPYTQAQVLTVPKPPLVSVGSIAYYDTSAVLTTLSSGAYTVATGNPGRISPTPGTTWPATQDRIGSVRITFTAGVGTLATDVPPQAILAIKMLVSHWYRNREAVTDKPYSEIPKGVDALLSSLKRGWYA
jgi:uncharacterized phiE125 gp8 family phage protein